MVETRLKVAVASAAAILAVAAAAVLGAGAALAHNPDAEQTATRGFGGISNVAHESVSRGTWTFEVVAVAGNVRDLTLVVKAACPTGVIYEYKKIKKPTVGMAVTTGVIDADGNPATNDNYCSQVAFPGGSAGASIKVQVSHQ